MMRLFFFSIVLFLFSCVRSFDHRPIDTTIINPDISKKTVITFRQLFNLHKGAIGKDTIVIGYVSSSDRENNFYKRIFVQNTTETSDLNEDNPRMGLQLKIGFFDSNIKFSKGRKIVINLEGLKKMTSKDILSLGKPNGFFISDIPEFEYKKFILKTDEIKEIVPKEVKLKDLTKNDLNTLIKLENIHFKKDEFGKSFSKGLNEKYAGNRALQSCESKESEILLETSNYASFSKERIPEKQIDLTGIYTVMFGKNRVILLNKFSDLKERGDYIDCEFTE